jgi:ParB family transcriptional regulator, chromosome partitioning protein
MHKALGRGLESLIPLSQKSGHAGDAVAAIDIDKIKPNKFQSRKDFNEDKLKELAQSIKQHGLAQPLLVCSSVIPGEYELIAGERRWRASKIAGLTEVPAIIKETDDKERFELSLIENIQRENLNAIEEAKAYKRLSEEFNHTQEELAKALGKDRSVLANTMRLLSLPEEIQDAISSGFVSAGHGRAIAGIEDEKKQKYLLEKILKEKLTVREIEAIVAQWKAGKIIQGLKKKGKKQEAELAGLADELQRKFGTKIKITGKPSKGKIEIHYFSLKELERISAMLKGKNR